MARTNDPGYVVRGKNGFDVQVPVIHPAYCVCELCKKPNNRPADAWGKEITIRTRRRSPYPEHRKQSEAYAGNLKKQIEAELRDAVAAARAREDALANAVSVDKVCAHYEAWQRDQNKDWQRDQYRVKEIKAFLGASRDAATVKFEDYTNFCAHLKKRGCNPATIRRYVNTLIAIFNRAVTSRVLPAHQLLNIERPQVLTTKKPVIFTHHQVAVLRGSAMLRYEREQAEMCEAFKCEQALRKLERRPLLTRNSPSVVPLRGLCEIAYMTLMRPETNFSLTWEQLTINANSNRGRFQLDAHKNADKGVSVDAPLKPELVRYLKNIMPDDGEPSGLVHPNPETNLPYVNIRKQWLRLVEIANEILAKDEQLTDERQHFYTWRHTGASHLAASSKDPVLVTRMMGDTQLATVMKHYFDSDFEHMQTEVEKWELPVEKKSAARRQTRRIESGIESGIESDPN